MAPYTPRSDVNGEDALKYYPLPEMIALYRQRKDIYREHLERGELTETNERQDSASASATSLSPPCSPS